MFLFLKVKIKGKKLLLGAKYGPNRNDKEFFKDIRVRLENVEEQIIIGGDFNTVLDHRQGIENLDKVNGGVIRNIENSREINSWQQGWRLVDPFRAKYSMVQEYSYISFRRNNEYGRSRLDFFMVDRDIMSWIKNIVYEDRLGRDFDHKEVTLILGKNGKRRNENIYKEKIIDIHAKYAGTCAMYDILNEHLRFPIERVRLQLGQIESKLRELNRNIGVMGGEMDINDERIVGPCSGGL